LSANTELVHLLKNGKSRVTKKDLEKKYGTGKSTIVRQTQNYPEILERYRKDKRRYYQPPLDHAEIAATEGTPLPEWDELINAVKEIKSGKDYFSDYEKVIEKLLTTLLYPSLSNPQKQVMIHEGRKRIDLNYTNVATKGFFYWLALHYPAPNIFIECKNYTNDIGNPELDQLAGRFSPSRGTVGLIICRGFDNKKLFLKRCQDTARDSRGFIIPLDDEDLDELILARKKDDRDNEFRLLKLRFNKLIM
jgi:Restriction endonuclease